MQAITQHLPESFLLLFLAITFLQSGLDKIIDWKGNLGWLRGHFAKTPFKNLVPQMLFTVLLAETASGVLSLAGIIELALTGDYSLGYIGAVLGCIALLMLLLGQRIARDYDGARTIVIYLIPTIFLLYLMQA
ncbi:DoxX family protein [Lentiprolixibacter aurantiacus]|uniref:DoxX family protein n=1 Tax=Lentiprolixibacter aurantiacus TaxID=2993939 RepID=A0AAE3MJZ3_9FLAO|nr:DoxX family protein [Lentiprolixibacter aurantiacus]MCX2718522.1 DoxX family protein [Lentiprolixibacter aurantiacus]